MGSLVMTYKNLAMPTLAMARQPQGGKIRSEVLDLPGLPQGQRGGESPDEGTGNRLPPCGKNGGTAEELQRHSPHRAG